jgi:hypothetical protein
VDAPGPASDDRPHVDDDAVFDHDICVVRVDRTAAVADDELNDVREVGADTVDDIEQRMLLVQRAQLQSACPRPRLFELRHADRLRPAVQHDALAVPGGDAPATESAGSNRGANEAYAVSISAYVPACSSVTPSIAPVRS